MYLLAVRSIFRKGNISSVKDINEQTSTKGTILYTFVKVSLFYNITSHHNVKCTLVQALRLCTGRTVRRGCRGIALLFHDHGTRRW